VRCAGSQAQWRTTQAQRRAAVLPSPICKLLVEAVAGNACDLGHACVRPCKSAPAARRLCMSLLHAVWYVAVFSIACCYKSTMACMHLHTPVVSCLSHRTNWWGAYVCIPEIDPATTMGTGDKKIKNLHSG
jgi:hypothetical protein